MMPGLEWGVGDEDGDGGTVCLPDALLAPGVLPGAAATWRDPGLGDPCEGKGILGWRMMLGACLDPTP